MRLSWEALTDALWNWLHQGSDREPATNCSKSNNSISLATHFGMDCPRRLNRVHRTYLARIAEMEF